MDSIFNYESINYTTNKKEKNTVPNFRQYENLLYAILKAYKDKYGKVFVFTGSGYSESEINFFNKYFDFSPKDKKDTISKDLINISYSNNFNAELDSFKSSFVNEEALVKDAKFLGMPRKVGIGVTIGVGVLAIAGIVFAIAKKKK